jgi:hypothetical protein
MLRCLLLSPTWLAPPAAAVGPPALPLAVERRAVLPRWTGPGRLAAMRVEVPAGSEGSAACSCCPALEVWLPAAGLMAGAGSLTRPIPAALEPPAAAVAGT